MIDKLGVDLAAPGIVTWMISQSCKRLLHCQGLF